nr:WGR domain-containing protein [Methylobacterium sp. ZNC0032]
MQMPLPFCLERVDQSRNMARFYAVSIEPTLFGDAALVREWGRIGRPGRRRLDLFVSVAKAQTALEGLRRRKLARGYTPRLSTRSTACG